jgi:hypothetical protein
MGVSDRFAFPKMLLRILLRGNRITAAAAGGRASDALSQSTDRCDQPSQHLRIGISTRFEDVCSLVLPQPYFRRSAVVDGRPWRLPFLAGC